MAYSRINNMLVSCAVVDVDCDAAQGGDFGCEFVEAGVVLSFCIVSLRSFSRASIAWVTCRDVLFAFVGHGCGECALGGDCVV